MKNLKLIIFLSVAASAFLLSPAGASADNNIGEKTKAYFNEMFGILKSVADQYPEAGTFREKAKPLAEKVNGMYGATLIDPDFVIRQVYYPSHFLARGFDLKNVEQLKDFYAMMKERPMPQLSEPGHGNVMQPALIAMRYPVIKDGKLVNIVSMMVRTKYFLKASGLRDCKAFKIICRGKLAEEKGELSDHYKEVKLSLPSTEWVIQYDE